MRDIQKIQKQYKAAKSVLAVLQKEEEEERENFVFLKNDPGLIYTVTTDEEYINHLKILGLWDSLNAAKKILLDTEAELLKCAFLEIPGWEDWKTLVKAASTDKRLKDELISIALGLEGDEP